MSKKQWWIALAIFFLAMNLRSTFLAITPLLRSLSETYHIDVSTLGLVTTIPLLVFGVLSSFMGTIGARLGVGRVMVASLILILFGEGLRYLLAMQGLFLGTFFIACGIVAGNVLIPPIVSAFFPKHINIMTSTYTSLMQVTTGLALASIGTLSLSWGWQNAVLLWCWPTVVALLLWIPLYSLDIVTPASSKASSTLGPLTTAEPSQKPPTIRSVFSQALAWDVSIFMGIQSLTYYSISTWYPAILNEHGIPLVAAGVNLSIFQITSLLTTFLLPLWLRKYREQKYFVVGLCVLYGVGLGLAYVIVAPWMAWLASALMGMAAGGVFVIAMLFFIIRSSSPAQSAVLSGVGQAIGYLLAAMMPVVLGYLYDQFHSWNSSLWILGLWLIVFVIFGYRAGRDRKLRISS